MSEAGGRRHEAPIKLADAVPWPGAPRCFKRVWDPEPSPLPYVITIPGPILIYGYACQSTFPEDKPVEREGWENGSFMAWCFSHEFPDPEIGFVPVTEITEVTEDELRRKAAEWGVIV